MSETYDYSRTMMATRNAAKKKQERLQLMVSLLFILSLATTWAYQTITGVSVLEVWAGLSVMAKSIIGGALVLLVALGLLFSGGMDWMYGAHDD